MNIRPIRSDADYELAMARIESLMDLEHPTRDQEDEIELLSLVIEAYERKTVSIDPPDPIEAIRFRMDQAGLKAADVAHCFGGRSRVYEVLNGRRALNVSMMRALHEHLGIPTDILLGRPGSRLPEPSGHDWKQFPLREMMKRGWFPTVKRIAGSDEVLIDTFLSQALGADRALALPSFRQGSRQNAKAEPYALAAWCCQAMILSSEDEPLPTTFDPEPRRSCPLSGADCPAQPGARWSAPCGRSHARERHPLRRVEASQPDLCGWRRHARTGWGALGGAHTAPRPTGSLLVFSNARTRPHRASLG